MILLHKHEDEQLLCKTPDNLISEKYHLHNQQSSELQNSHLSDSP